MSLSSHTTYAYTSVLETVCHEWPDISFGWQSICKLTGHWPVLAGHHMHIYELCPTVWDYIMYIHCMNYIYVCGN